MRRLIASAVIGLGLSASIVGWAQEPGVISHDELEAAKTAERNTYYNEEHGFSARKPEDWNIYTSADTYIARGFAVTFNENPTYGVKQTLVAMTKFPADATWALVNPMLKVDIYEFKDISVSPEQKESALIEISDAVALLLQTRGRIVLPPTSTQIDGRPARKLGLFISTPIKDGEAQEIEVYLECYLQMLNSDEFLLIQFSANPADVPTHRKDVDAIVDSIKFTEPKPATDTQSDKTVL